MYSSDDNKRKAFNLNLLTINSKKSTPIRFVGIVCIHVVYNGQIKQNRIKRTIVSVSEAKQYKWEGVKLVTKVTINPLTP